MPVLFSMDNKGDCCGCTACYAVCPTDAIYMKADEEGFLYPQIDGDKCIQCNACVKSCPLKDEQKDSDAKETNAFYALKNKNSETVLSSTSGGAFTAFSDFILENGGVVYGVIFDKELNALHSRAETKEERDAMRTSKYLQSDMKDTFKQAKCDVENGKLVLFTGTPCQIAGLKKFLKKDPTDRMDLSDAFLWNDQSISL